MTGRFGDWPRESWARLRRRSRERRDEFGEPWPSAFTGSSGDVAECGDPESPARERATAPVSALRLVDDADPPVRDRDRGSSFVSALHPAADAGPPGRDRDAALVSALHRVADTFERVADSLDADRRDRRARLDDVDGLLREIVSGLRQPTAVPPVVIGGSIDPPARDHVTSTEGREGQLDLTGPDVEEPGDAPTIRF
jgi:hypothetical protein